MPRCNRYFMPDKIWHITHRCHKRDFLLKFRRNRKRWIHWLFEAKKRYGLCVLNYCVTSNHIHLLVFDRGKKEIIRSMQLIESRVAQEYNIYKKREGSFWDDRYHATIIEDGNYLLRCSSYIDFNMVRAGAVNHPSKWKECGYNEIMADRTRYRIIDREKLSELLELSDVKELPEFYNIRTEYILTGIEDNKYEPEWTESIAVGSEHFTEKVKKTITSQSRDIKILPDGKAILS